MMRFLTSAAIILFTVRTLNFALYNWRNDNKIAGIGSFIISTVAILFPIIVLFSRV